MVFLPHPIHKINSKWLKDLNIRCDTIKLLEDDISKPFSDIDHTSVFLGQSPKAIEIKGKINKWGLIKLTGSGSTDMKQEQTFSEVRKEDAPSIKDCSGYCGSCVETAPRSQLNWSVATQNSTMVYYQREIPSNGS